MSPRLLPFPSPVEARRLHARLLAGDDPTASADVCQAYLAPLLAWLGQHHQTADPDLVQSAVHQALFAYLQRPESYDPRRRALHGYLQMAAASDLANLLRTERRHQRRRICLTDVEETAFSGKIIKEDDPLPRLQEKEEQQARQAVVSSVVDRLPSGERVLLERMLAGENDTASCARALGVDGLPAPEQERAVKRAKDRIKKRLRREASERVGLVRIQALERGGNSDA